MSTKPTRRGAASSAARRAVTRVGAISPELGDALLYFVGGVFAVVTIFTSSEALYRQWGELAVGPLMFGALAAGVLAVVVARRKAAKPVTEPRAVAHRVRWEWGGRIVVAACVFAGATAIPLGLEILWRADNDPGTHAQPEVGVIESAGQQLAKGKDPYHAVTNSHGKVVYHAAKTSTVDAFNPYLPIMDAFGIPSAAKKHDVGLTDARIFFSFVTLLVTGVALALCRSTGRRKMRALQVLTILPTAALPLATGGDDMPVVAVLLLAMVLAQRRHAFASGVVLGIVSAMKFTAWPLAGLALFAARNRRGARRPGTMFFGMLVVAGPVVIPFALRGPWAFFDNVILFPLGLSGVTSPAASPLPGHLLVSAFPFLHRALPVTVGLLGGALLAWYLYRRPPRTVSQVCTIGGVVMAVATLLAPATRIGYLLYPINFFVWAYLFADSAQRGGRGELGHETDPGLSRQLTYSAPPS
ncbi:MAG TPA: glycosyltransferase 87 family protein [Acidimicrobiales bacterium]|jgi:hypothetical protein